MKTVTDDNNELILEKEKQIIINNIEKERLDAIKQIINNYLKNYIKNEVSCTTEIKNGGTNGN